MPFPKRLSLANGRAAVCLLAIGLALFLSIRSDVGQARWAERVSQEGTPPPERDASSETGYALGQRAFLSSRESGETYRWIARAQEILAHGPFSHETYHGDTVPVGRPQLLPQAYAAWLVAVAGALSAVTGEPLAISAENAALWSPLIGHALALLAAALFMWRRCGPIGAAAAAALFAFSPWIADQFLPGVLSPRAGALLLAAYAIAVACGSDERSRGAPAFGLRAALAGGLALWLDPSLGFPALLAAAAAGFCKAMQPDNRSAFLKWAAMGAGLVTAAWAIDGARWDLPAGELRFVHPLYALAWLGLGAILDGACALKRASARPKARIAELALGVALLAPLAIAQLRHGYWGWLYPAPESLQLTPARELVVFRNVADWAPAASGAEVALALAPALAAAIWIATALVRKRERAGQSTLSLPAAAVAMAAVMALACVRVHWLVAATLVALPILGDLARSATRPRAQGAAVAAAIYLLALVAWPQLSVGAPDATPKADLTKLAYRHFSHWLATHTPGREVRILASPELSDSVIYHGGGQALMSTAWQSHPGLIAATRVLGAPEATEAEAVLDSRQITHIALTSWETVLPLLAQATGDDSENTLYHRLQVWNLPPYLRPIPYRLPPAPEFASQKLALFERVPHQDDALALSRLAEYFAEMDRPEPALLAAEALAKSFPDNPNAAIARALVFSAANDSAGFRQELARLQADAEAGRAPSDWDRRALRAIVFALGQRAELARAELQACVASMDEEGLRALTPLQAFRMRALMRRYRLDFPSPELAAIANALCAEYGL